MPKVMTTSGSFAPSRERSSPSSSTGTNSIPSKARPTKSPARRPASSIASEPATTSTLERISDPPRSGAAVVLGEGVSTLLSRDLDLDARRTLLPRAGSVSGTVARTPRPSPSDPKSAAPSSSSRPSPTSSSRFVPRVTGSPSTWRTVATRAAARRAVPHLALRSTSTVAETPGSVRAGARSRTSSTSPTVAGLGSTHSRAPIAGERSSGPGSAPVQRPSPIRTTRPGGRRSAVITERARAAAAATSLARSPSGDASHPAPSPRSASRKSSALPGPKRLVAPVAKVMRSTSSPARVAARA